MLLQNDLLVYTYGKLIIIERKEKAFGLSPDLKNITVLDQIAMI